MEEATHGIDNHGFVSDGNTYTNSDETDSVETNKESIIVNEKQIDHDNVALNIDEDKTEEPFNKENKKLDKHNAKSNDNNKDKETVLGSMQNEESNSNNNKEYDNDTISLIGKRDTKIVHSKPEFNEPESNETSIDLSIFDDSQDDKSNDIYIVNDDQYKVKVKIHNTDLNNERKISAKENDGFPSSDSVTYRSYTEKTPKNPSKGKSSLFCRRKKQMNEEVTESDMKPSNPELSRSQYSLVSTGELTAEALQVWKALPKKIKYDPEMAPFQQRYEKEYGKAENIHLKSKNGSVAETKRLPLVKSAPHLNNNVKVIDEAPGVDGKSGVEVLDPNKDGSGLENGGLRMRSSKFALARHYIKMTMVLACWIFFTLVFLLYNEKEHILRNSSISPGEVKSYILNISDTRLSMYVKLSGPFITQQAEARMNSSEREAFNKMSVWLERWTIRDMEQGRPVTEGDATRKEVSKPWTMVLQDDELLDFSKGEHRSRVLHLTTNQTESNQTSVFALRMKTTAQKTSPFTITYTLNPIDMNSGVICSCVLLCGLYVLIIFEIINRTMAAVLISTTALATLAVVGERPSLPELVSWLDVETLLLLFSMMLLVAIMAETGMFDFLAVFTFEVTKGKLWPLITLLCIITALLSTFLDNVTTVLLMTPVTIRLCEVMDLDPVPILMSMVLFSNIGGTATPVGDPPNVIIASNRAIVQAGINFTNFTMHMTLGILVVCVQTYFQLRYIYRDANKLRSNEPREIQDLRHQISIWRRAIESLPHLSKDQHVVRERLERKMKKLNVQLETMIKESHKRVCPKDTFQSTLDELKKKYKIRDKMLLLKSTIAISFVVILFFLHSIPELNRVSLGWTALLGAILLLLLADREDLEPILHRVEWSTLLFFAALFVLMEALSKLGLIEFIGGITQNLILGVHEKARLAVALLLMLWVSGVTSAFVDNIPLTTMMVRVVIELGSNPNLNLPMAPLIWALSFGACLGGNGTLIGASANVVCAGVAEQHGYRFTFMQFFKVGFPVMIGHLIVASGYLLLCHCVFTWH